MKDIAYIDLKQCIFQDNNDLADKVKEVCKKHKIFLWNLMSSPGAGKTTFITKIIENLRDKYRFGIIEADIESTCDSEKIQKLGIDVVQLRTGGFCHLEASMILKAFEELPLDDLDVIIVENVGNLVCPAEFVLGEDFPCMILSVPEGDDKAIKYPLMFTVTKALVISKTDVAPYFDFDFDAVKKNASKLNNELKIFPLSCKTGDGVEDFVNYIDEEISRKVK